MTLRQGLALAAVAVAGALPLLGQPVQVDDPLFLGVARQILATPASPFAGTPPYSDGSWFAENANPPLWSYALAAAALVAGWHELAFQCVQALAYGLLVFGLFRLCRRATERPLFWTTAAATAPFLLPGRNLMVDTAMLALWVWSLDFQFRAWETTELRPAWIAGLLAAAALLTKYTAGLLLPLFVIGCLIYRRPRALFAVVPPLVALGLWCGHNLHFYGALHLFAQPLRFPPDDLVERLRILPRILGGVVWWTPVWLMAVVLRTPWHAVTLSVLATLAVIGGVVDQQAATDALNRGAATVTDAMAAHYAVFSTNGWLVVALGLLLVPWRLHSPRERARLVLAAWALLSFAFNLLAAPPVAFGAVRHIAGLALPLLLFAAGPADDMVRRFRWSWLLLVLCLAANLGLALLLAHADRLVGSVAIVATEECVRPHVARQRVWCAGDPALRYYAEPAGAMRWRGDWNELRPGDWLVFPYFRNLARVDDPEFHGRCRSVLRKHVTSWNPLLTQHDNINFYGANRFTLPWRWVEPKARMQGAAAGAGADTILLLEFR